MEGQTVFFGQGNVSLGLTGNIRGQFCANCAIACIGQAAGMIALKAVRSRVEGIESAVYGNTGQVMAVQIQIQAVRKRCHILQI